jgi:hypothetical protein
VLLYIYKCKSILMLLNTIKYPEHENRFTFLCNTCIRINTSTVLFTLYFFLGNVGSFWKYKTRVTSFRGWVEQVTVLKELHIFKFNRSLLLSWFKFYSVFFIHFKFDLTLLFSRVLDVLMSANFHCFWVVFRSINKWQVNWFVHNSTIFVRVQKLHNMVYW